MPLSFKVKRFENTSSNYHMKYIIFENYLKSFHYIGWIPFIDELINRNELYIIKENELNYPNNCENYTLLGDDYTKNKKFLSKIGFVGFNDNINERLEYFKENNYKTIFREFKLEELSGIKNSDYNYILENTHHLEPAKINIDINTDTEGICSNNEKNNIIDTVLSNIFDNIEIKKILEECICPETLFCMGLNAQEMHFLIGNGINAKEISNKRNLSFDRFSIYKRLNKKEIQSIENVSLRENLEVLFVNDHKMCLNNKFFCRDFSYFYNYLNKIYKNGFDSYIRSFVKKNNYCNTLNNHAIINLFIIYNIYIKDKENINRNYNLEEYLYKRLFKNFNNLNLLLIIEIIDLVGVEHFINSFQDNCKFIKHSINRLILYMLRIIISSYILESRLKYKDLFEPYIKSILQEYSDDEHRFSIFKIIFSNIYDVNILNIIKDPILLERYSQTNIVTENLFKIINNNGIVDLKHCSPSKIINEKRFTEYNLLGLLIIDTIDFNINNNNFDLITKYFEKRKLHLNHERNEIIGLLIIIFFSKCINSEIVNYFKNILGIHQFHENNFKSSSVNKNHKYLCNIFNA